MDKLNGAVKSFGKADAWHRAGFICPDQIPLQHVYACWRGNLRVRPIDQGFPKLRAEEVARMLAEAET